MKSSEKNKTKLQLLSKMKKLKTFYADSYPAIWDQFEFLVNKINRQDAKFQILLVVAAALFAIFFTLKIWEVDPLNYLAIMTNGLVFLISLYNLVPRKVTVPWINDFEFKKYEKYSNSEKLMQHKITELYKFIGGINTYMDKTDKRLMICLELTLFSAFWPIIVWAILKGAVIHLSVVLIGTMISLMIIFWERKGKPYS